MHVQAVQAVRCKRKHKLHRHQDLRKNGFKPLQDLKGGELIFLKVFTKYLYEQ